MSFNDKSSFPWLLFAFLLRVFIGEYMKKCSCCRIEKSFTEFHKNKSAKSGYSNYCIECRKLTRNNPRGTRQALDVFDQTRGNHVVYQFYDINDECIYVGQSINFIRRLNDHKVSNVFYSQITKIVCNIVESYPDMIFLEAQLIIEIKPKYNKQVIGAIASKSKIYVTKIVEYDIEGVELKRKTI